MARRGAQKLDGEVQIGGLDYLWDEDTVESFFSATSFRSDRRTQTVDGRADGTDWGLVAGFLWSLDDRWRLGGVYREGPKLDFEIGLEAGPANLDFPPGPVGSLAFPWSFPDVWGLGVSFRSADGRWTAGAEWDHVTYSVIADSFPPEIAEEDESIPDADELRLGGERVFLASRPLVAVRCGLLIPL